MPRTPGAIGQKTKNAAREVDAKDLKPPKRHKKGEDWTEEEAIAELEFLIRFLDNEDPKKLFYGQCLSFRKYSEAGLYNGFVKKWPNSCAPLFEYARMIQRDKVATNALTKDYDSRFAVFAMSNISDWRQNHQVDVSSTIQIKTKDYKGIQPAITERMDRARKGGK